MKRSFLCILICLMLVVGALASCADSGDEQSSSGSLSQSVSGNGGEGFKYDGYFNGQTVKILCVNTDICTESSSLFRMTNLPETL